MKRVLPLLMMIAVPATAAEPPITPCSLSANVIDSDPAGANVRSGPGQAFPAILRLTPDGADTVEILGASGRWLRLGQVWEQEGEPLFRADGWVYAPLLGVTTTWNSTDPQERGRNALRSAPAVTGRVTAWLEADTFLSLEGCSGSWAKVRYPGGVGWLAHEGQCTNTFTTCS